MFKFCIGSVYFNQVFAIILIYFAHRIQSQTSKCCPIDSVLEIQNDISCRKQNYQSHWDFYNLSPSTNEISSNCSVHRNVFNRNKSFIEINGCIDQDSNKQFVEVSCPQTHTTGVRVHLMNKCCPVGQSYNHSGRFCTEDSDSHGHFKRLFGARAIVFENKVPDCTEEEVFVEYLSKIHNILFEGDKLKVDDNILSADKFCIEDLNIDSSDKHLIIRSCRPRSVCKEVPCIRRCCKADQFMNSTELGKKQCRSHPNKVNLAPLFHDISFPLSNTQKQTHLEGMNNIKVFIPILFGRYIWSVKHKLMTK